MSATFAWAVITPEATVESGTCDFLVVPGAAGEIGIMAGHAALVAGVVPGDVRVTVSGATHTVRVGAGLVDVRENQVRVLVSAAGGAAAPASSDA